MGYDWKIGIALITSFAAREVFVGTMATLYSVEDKDNSTLQEKMQSAVQEDGTKVYTLPAALSLMVFYVFAMQCMSTLAVVKRETRTWKWPDCSVYLYDRFSLCNEPCIVLSYFLIMLKCIAK